jgi:hypothetical protein
MNYMMSLVIIQQLCEPLLEVRSCLIDIVCISFNHSLAFQVALHELQCLVLTQSL